MNFSKYNFGKNLSIVITFILLIFTSGNLKSQFLNNAEFSEENTNGYFYSIHFNEKKNNIRNNFGNSPAKDSVKFDKTFEILIGAGVSFPFYDPIKESLKEQPSNPLVQNLPENWFWDNWDMGYIIEVGAGYNFAPKVTASLLVDYSAYTLDKAEYLKSINGYGINNDAITVGKTSVLTVTANLKGDLSKFFYFTFGTGVFSFSVPDIKIKNTYYSFYPHFSSYEVEETYKGDDDTGITLGLGFGMQFPIGGVKPFIEFDYSYFFMKGENTSYFPVKGGLMYKF